MKLQELLQYGNQILKAAGIAEFALDARYLLEWALQQPHAYLLMHGMDEAAEEQVQKYQSAVELRRKHIPLQYITHAQEFMGYSFYVNEHVLIPRQDTEVLVETVIQQVMKHGDLCADGRIRILDLCCGSGCIGISLKKLLQAKGIAAEVTLSDISPEALKVASRNAEVLQCDVTIVEGDLFAGIRGQYDIIVSNPPYIPSRVVDTLMPEVRYHEPRLALDGAEDGLRFYRRIIKEAVNYLEDEGYVFFEIGFNQAEDIRKILVDAGYDRIKVNRDLVGLDRVIEAHIGRRTGVPAGAAVDVQV